MTIYALSKKSQNYNDPIVIGLIYPTNFGYKFKWIKMKMLTNFSRISTDRLG